MLRNLLIPFRRDQKNDFASGTGGELLISKVTQVLMTDGSSNALGGELPWRTAFGSKLSLLRHRNNNEVLQALARVWIKEALARWLPKVQLVSVRCEKRDALLVLRVKVKEGSTTQEGEIPIYS